MYGDWQRVRALFEELVELEGEARASRLALLSETEPELHSELLFLLAAEDGATHRLAPLESPKVARSDFSRLPSRFEEELDPRYQVEREVGRGGMATVFLACDTKHDRRVALKVLRPEVGRSVEAERFLREIRIAARLTHPNILPLHDSGEAGGLLYYVMPFVEEESVRERLAREGPLPIDEAVRIAREVCEGLAHAHAHGVIHRDIKPDNILLSGGHAVIADFGIARALAAVPEEQGSTGPAKPITRTGLAIGTPAYMSPEQAAGGERLDGRSDLYALGCVLYAMLTGGPPFQAPSSRGVLVKHWAEAPPGVRVTRPEVPQPLEAVVAKALAKDPAHRFASAQAMSEALANVSRSVSPGRPPLWRSISGVAAALTVLGTGGWLVSSFAIGPGPGHAAAPHPRTAIAVLPFEDLSADPAHAHFAGGLHDELLTQLSRVAGLSLRGRTSVMGYAATTKAVPEVAEELRVGALVTGRVQVVAGRLRVSVQLIDAVTDEHLWAERYDRTLDDAFGIQSDIAQKVVAAVGAALERKERQALAQPPTSDPEAYRLYLQGRDYYRRPGYEWRNHQIAEQLYERAVALDPEFALAYAALSQVHGDSYWFRRDPSPEREARQREAAEMAMRLAPELPEAQMAMGRWHLVRRDWAAALAHFERAASGLPNDAETHAWIGYVHRRMGNWEEVFAAFERATELDPRHADLIRDLGGMSYLLTRRYADAVRSFDRALTLAPDLHDAVFWKGWTHVLWQGELDSLRAVLERMPAEGLACSRIDFLLWARQPERLIAAVESCPHAVFQTAQTSLPKSLYAAWAHELLGDESAARLAFDSARALLDSVVMELPEDWTVRVARGHAYAGLGRREEALGEARWLEQSDVYREDAFSGARLAEKRAQILARAGAAEAALDEIERLLATPSWVTVHTLRLDPLWDPIREDPRFQALANAASTPRAAANIN